MKPSLQARLTQHLALTPQLQQSIRLLQLSTLELHQEVLQMIERNPFLEAEGDEDLEPLQAVADIAPAEAFDAAVERSRERDAAPEAEAAPGDEAAGRAGDDGGALAELGERELAPGGPDDWDDGAGADDADSLRELPSAAGSGAGGPDSDDLDASERRSVPLTLAEHLRAQLPGLRLGDEDAAAVRLLIDSLDDDGYLIDSLESIATGIGADTLGDDDREDLMCRLRCARHWLQRLDPPGVGAADLAECLAIQLRLGPPGEARRIALAIVAEHLEALARRDAKRLCAALGCDEALLREAQALIVRCEPRPGRPFADTAAAVVVPDVVVQRSGRNLKVSLNPDVMPRLRINDLYAAALKGQRGTALSSHLQEARWFMKNVQQRFETILRVSRAIVERQRAFFIHGDIAMKPLVLREIADELGLHESTISRVTTAKYMATPQGTFELKYFFASSLATEAGGNASSTAVRALIRQLVGAEDPARPLSDSALSELLERQGIQVARRTVAKYREALKIAPANLRKAI